MNETIPLLEYLQAADTKYVQTAREAKTVCAVPSLDASIKTDAAHCQVFAL